MRKEDIQKYINENPSSATIPAKATVRYIFLPVPSAGSSTIHRETEATMDKIRDQIVNGEFPFEEAAKRYSQALNAPNGGLVSDFEPGTFFSTFDEKAFGLNPGEVSPVIFGPDGIYLLKVITLKPAESISPENLDSYIRHKLYFRQLQHRYSYALLRLREKTIVENGSLIIDNLEPDARALRVDKFQLTANQLWNLFPNFVSWELRINKDALYREADRIITLELIAQSNEKNQSGSRPHSHNRSPAGYPGSKGSQSPAQPHRGATDR